MSRKSQETIGPNVDIPAMTESNGSHPRGDPSGQTAPRLAPGTRGHGPVGAHASARVAPAPPEPRATET